MKPVVLVVDDNDVNRLMLVRMLAASGLDAAAAADGGEAVDYVAEHDCDLVFMDCMMPVLDGIEATRAIRAAGGVSARAWIVAVTANTLSHDRERCLVAGMNDYLSKPFTLDALDAVLGRWAAARNQPVPVRPPGAPPPPPCIPGCEVDFSGLDQLVRFAGHQALSDVAKAFLNDIPIQLQSLQAAQASGQADRLRQVAHRLKGACGTAGLVGAQRLAAALEVSAKTGDLGSSEADCARLIESVHCGSTRLRQHIDAG